MNEAESRRESDETEEIVAVVVWEGKAKADATAAFAEQAKARNIPVREIPTL